MNELKLQPVKHDNKSQLWCGPAVLSAISGVPTSTIHIMLRAVTKRRRIMGTHIGALRKVAQQLGYNFVNHYVGGKPSLAAWLRTNRDLVRQNVIIVGLTHHWVAVNGRSFVDSHEPNIVPLGSAPHRRCRVKSIVTVYRNGAAPQLPPPPPKKVDRQRKFREQAKALAKLHAVPIEPYENGPGEFWVWPPKELGAQEDDRFYDEHLAYDWHDVLRRVQGYVEDLLKRKQPVIAPHSITTLSCTI